MYKFYSLSNIKRLHGILEVENLNDVPTLLPYLDASRAHLHLKISLISEKAEIQEKSSFPFFVIIDSDPLTRLIEAQFVTDEGSELKRVFLLVQRDRYSFQSDELWPIDNQKIDDLWQKAFSFHANKDQESPLITLSQQLSEVGKLRPFHSLFFCKARQLFFHPPCPKCGCFLHQCDDDDLLIRSGLQPFSISLKRYLFCPLCAREGSSDFYIYELESNDYPGLKDWQSLIKEFGRLILDKKQNAQIPCVDCPQHHGCYGANHQVLSMLVPFSFYPFYMFVFEAMSLHGLDFLSLLSGATFKEVEALLSNKGERGRVHSLNLIQQKGLKKVPVLFAHDRKNFSEILYLKLSFLEEMIQTIFPNGGAKGYPDLKFSMDRIWVKLVKQSRLLPFFWNFKVKMIDIGGNPFGTKSFPELSLFHRLHFLTRVWFYTLLVNKKQNISKVYEVLAEKGERLSENNFGEIFPPTNIFWDPEGKGVSKTAEPLWEKSLRLGWSLYQNSLNSNLSWVKEVFLKEMDDLREKVKKDLFLGDSIESDRTKRPETGVEARAKDEIVRNILVGILNRWLSEAKREELIPETLILSPLKMGRDATTASRLDGDKRMGSPAGRDKTDIHLKAVQESYGEDVIVETVILGPGKSISSPVHTGQGEKRTLSEKRENSGPVVMPEEKPVEEDILTETVIIDPQKVQGKRKIKRNE